VSVDCGTFHEGGAPLLSHVAWYGIVEGDTPLTVANATGFVLGLCQVRSPVRETMLNIIVSREARNEKIKGTKILRGI
jgi:hypothetical protein